MSGAKQNGMLNDEAPSRAVMVGVIVAATGVIFMASFCLTHLLVDESLKEAPATDLWGLLELLEEEGKRRRRPRIPPGQQTQLQKLLTRPATALLMATNAGGFLWQKLHPDVDVAVSTNDIVDRRQYWRSLTAVFAHANAFHLLMNMSSLQSLGEALEQGFMAFLTTTFAAIIYGEAIACLLDVSLSFVMTSSSPHRRRLGFSGVLFSWMVVATSTKDSVYCLPFNLCFTTHELGPFRVNAAPFILAAAIQVVVPRASFVGHAAGAIAGFPLTAGLVLSPTTLLVLVALFDIRRQRRSIGLSTRGTSVGIVASTFLGHHNVLLLTATLLVVAVGHGLPVILAAVVQASSFAALAGTLAALDLSWRVPLIAALGYAVVGALFIPTLVPDLLPSTTTHVGGVEEQYSLRLYALLRRLSRSLSVLSLRRTSSVPFTGHGQLLGSGGPGKKPPGPASASAKSSPPPSSSSLESKIDDSHPSSDGTQVVVSI